MKVRRTGLGPTVGGYGWTGGLGSSWANDPSEDLVGMVLTTDAFTGAFPPPRVIQDFWTGTYAALVVSGSGRAVAVFGEDADGIGGAVPLGAGARRPG